MPTNGGETRQFGVNLKHSRLAAKMTQTALAKAAKVPRLRIVRAEMGMYVLDLNEATRIARVLKVPLERLATGRWMPDSDLRGIAFELYHLGIRDLEVANAQVPGSFRRAEQVTASAVKGDNPEPRVVEAMPSVLARRALDVPLTLAFADIYDPRIRTRLAWLSDITLALKQLADFPIRLTSEAQLVKFVRAGVRPPEPDSLGHPREGKLPRIWERWNVTYVGNLADFAKRTLQVELEYQRSDMSAEPEE